MKKRLATALIVLSMISFQSCYYDKAELVYPDTTACTTTGMTYTTNIQSIIQTNCYSCHAGTAQQVQAFVWMIIIRF